MARTMLVQSAWLIMRSRDHEDPLRNWALHIAKTRGKKIAAVALARKLAGVLWAMWRDGTVYDRAWQAQKSAQGIKSSAREQEHRAQAMARAARKLQRNGPAAGTTASRPRAKPRKPSSEMSAKQ